MRCLYLVSSGPADPTRASIPFHLAVNGSLEVGQEPGLVLAGDATEFVLPGTLDAAEGLGLPPLRELFAKVKEHGVPLYV